VGVRVAVEVAVEVAEATRVAVTVGVPTVGVTDGVKVTVGVLVGPGVGEGVGVAVGQNRGSRPEWGRDDGGLDRDVEALWIAQLIFQGFFDDLGVDRPEDLEGPGAVVGAQL
jgi:hypothetical protein